jgi:hypothetical protein
VQSHIGRQLARRIETRYVAKLGGDGGRYMELHSTQSLIGTDNRPQPPTADVLPQALLGMGKALRKVRVTLCRYSWKVICCSDVARETS